jgi:short-subunit dehydrogenase
MTITVRTCLRYGLLGRNVPRNDVPMSERSTAVITGATSGIGLGFARLLAPTHDLVLVARDRARLDQVATGLAPRTHVTVESADLGIRDDVDRIASLIADRADVLINNAGFGLRESFTQASVEHEQQTIDVMVTAVMRLTHACLPRMVQQNAGVVINVSSVAGWITSGTYSSAKAWVTNFSESLNATYRGTGVNVTALCPGYVRTEFHQRMGVGMKGVPAWMWLDVDQVASDAWRDAVKGKATSVPSVRYRLLAQFLRIAPRSLVRKATASRVRSALMSD